MPPSACSNQPLRRRGGAGERALLVAEQLRVDQLGSDRAAVDAAERPLRNVECSWMARAMISLPVPVSPNSSTGALLRATIRARAITAARPVSPPIRRSSARARRGDQVLRDGLFWRRRAYSVTYASSDRVI